MNGIFRFGKQKGHGILAYAMIMAMASSLVTTFAIIGQQGVGSVYTMVSHSIEDFFVAQTLGLTEQEGMNVTVHHRKKRSGVFTP